MLLTPTMIGAILAGICLWTLFWAALHKIEEIPYVRDILTTNDCLDWIQQRPGLTILLTEASELPCPRHFFPNRGWICHGRDDRKHARGLRLHPK